MFRENGKWIIDPDNDVPLEKIQKLRREHRQKFKFLQEEKEKVGEE